jgi:hypothetical protein
MVTLKEEEFPANGTFRQNAKRLANMLHRHQEMPLDFTKAHLFLLGTVGQIGILSPDYGWERRGRSKNRRGIPYFCPVNVIGISAEMPEIEWNSVPIKKVRAGRCGSERPHRREEAPQLSYA